MPNKHSYWWQDKSWTEITEQAKKCDIAILPMGAIEQHGPHLPTGHDTLQLFPMLEKVAEKTDVMLLPCPWYGAHPSHHWGFPGTIPLQNSTAVALMKDIIRGAAIAGFNKFIIFYGHGQAWATNTVVQDLGVEGYYVLALMFQNMVADIYDQIFETPFWHADEAETSIALHTHPQYVDMSLAVKGVATTSLDKRFVRSPSLDHGINKWLRFDEGTIAAPEYKDLEYGTIGDPTLATLEKGEKYCNYIVERTCELIEYIKARYPAGVKVHGDK